MAHIKGRREEAGGGGGHRKSDLKSPKEDYQVGQSRGLRRHE